MTPSGEDFLKLQASEGALEDVNRNFERMAIESVPRPAVNPFAFQTLCLFKLIVFQIRLLKHEVIRPAKNDMQFGTFPISVEIVLDASAQLAREKVDNNLRVVVVVGGAAKRDISCILQPHACPSGAGSGG